MDDVYQQSLALHREHKGKMELTSKVTLKTKQDLSLAYTPGVAEVCREIARDESLAYEYTIKANTIAIVSDGSAILGLGNLGAKAAIPVMEGKAILFKEFAGVDAFPICLDTEDSEEIIKAVKLIAPVFGGINLEDISAPRCFEIEERLKKELDIPVMHDDQHGTATVVLAALINAMKLKNLDKTVAKILINGAGSAGVAITKMLLEYGFKNIIVCDSQGAISEARHGLNGAKDELAKATNKEKIIGSLAEAIVGRDVFIGVSMAGLLTAEMVKSMNDQPVIFAMANPTPEIMPELAKEAGAYIVATGRSDYPNQINNVLAFPGIFRGALDNKVSQITDAMLVRAAEALAAMITEPNPELIIPSPLDRVVAKVIAAQIY